MTKKILSLEGIINECFSNTERFSIPSYRFTPTRTRTIDMQMTAKNLMDRISSIMPASQRDFNDKKINYLGTSRLEPTVDKNTFLKKLESSTWRGPFKDDQ